MAKPITIAGIPFKTKKAAEDFIRAIRDRYGNGDRVMPPDENFLLELITLHPEHEQKRGVGVSHFVVGLDGKFGTTRCFYIHRVDGSHTDVSFKTCLDGVNPRREVLGAMRQAVSDQIITFRNSELDRVPPPRCPIRDLELSRDYYHVDHAKPATFDSIADEWLATIGGIAAVKISPPKDMQFHTEMTCPQQMQAWQEHHRRLAQLRLTSPIANLSDLKKGTKSKNANASN